MKINRPRNHYDYLAEHLPRIFEKLNLNWNWNAGIISAHGDKGYGYKEDWEKAEIPFEHGMVVYLLSYVKPYSSEVRETAAGWIAPSQWVINNYSRFAAVITEVENEKR